MQIDTTPPYPRPPDRERLDLAKDDVVILAEGMPTGHMVLATDLCGQLTDRGFTAAVAMWAIHDLIQAGGFTLFPVSTERALSDLGVTLSEHLETGIVTDDSGRVIYPGEPFPLPTDSPVDWRVFYLRPRHEELWRIRDEQHRAAIADLHQWFQSRREKDEAREPHEDDSQERASAGKLFPLGVPDNNDLVDLAVRLDSERDSGKSMNQIAREYTGGDIAKANSLLSLVRRFRRQGRLNL